MYLKCSTLWTQTWIFSCVYIFTYSFKISDVIVTKLMTVFLLYVDLCMGSRNRPTKREDPDRTQTVDYLAGLETLPLVSDGGINLFISLYTQKKSTQCEKYNYYIFPTFCFRTGLVFRKSC